jgi:hypothetical protein
VRDHNKVNPGSTFDPACSRQSIVFSEVAVVGHYFPDAGCLDDSILVESSLYPSLTSATPVILARAGWATANQDARARLALAWLEDFSSFKGGWHIVHERPSAAFAMAPASTPPFEPPHAEPLAGGGAMVGSWVTRCTDCAVRWRTRDSPVHVVYTLRRFELSADGKATSSKDLSTFSVPEPPPKADSRTSD